MEIFKAQISADKELFCPTCQKVRRAPELASCKETRESSHSNEYTEQVPYCHYSFYQCSTCTAPILTAWPEWSEEGQDAKIVFPLPPLALLEKDSERITDLDVRRDLKEADRCYHNHLWNAFAAMARRTVYSICHNKNACGKTIKDQIGYLQNKNEINLEQAKLAIALSELGDFGVHPEWPPVSEEQALEGFKRLIELICGVYNIPRFQDAPWSGQSRRYRQPKDPANALEQQAMKQEKQERKARDREQSKKTAPMSKLQQE